MSHLSFYPPQSLRQCMAHRLVLCAGWDTPIEGKCRDRPSCLRVAWEPAVGEGGSREAEHHGRLLASSRAASFRDQVEKV